MKRCMSKLPHRRSIRLKDYDYRQPGAYFITICVNGGTCLLDEPDIADMISHWWNTLPDKFPNVEVDEFIVMPNHIHGILLLREKCTNGIAPTVGDIVRWFKTMTTNAYIKGVKQRGWRPFHKRLWQRNYYERVIRDEKELTKIREYIRFNLLKWDLDRENPDRIGSNPDEDWLYR